MSTAVMPAGTIYDFEDALKSNLHLAPLSMKTSECKPTSQPLARRNSNPVGSVCGQKSYTISFTDIDNSVLMNNNNAISNNIINTHRKLDRSQSEPSDRSSPGHKNNINTSRYKTELCRPFEENGTCKYGDKCQFAHGAHELRSLARHHKYKTELCRTFHTIGFCPYGPRCHFIHNAEEARAKMAQLQGSHPEISQAVQPIRPTPLTFSRNVTFSLGSNGDSPSPPSSLSESPTNIGTFFTDELLAKFSANPNNVVPNNFTFGPEFPTAVLVAAPTSNSYVGLKQSNARSSPHGISAVMAIKEELKSSSVLLQEMEQHSPPSTDDASQQRLPVFNHIVNRFAVGEAI